KPAIVFIDTVLHATDHAPHKVEEARRFFYPLQKLCLRQNIVMACCTHLSASGGPHGRMIPGLARVVMEVEEPEEQCNRRRLSVVKSNSEKPPALGVTIGTGGNDYDNNPPAMDGAAGSNRKAAPREKRVDECAAWLEKLLADGPERLKEIRKRAHK